MGTKKQAILAGIQFLLVSSNSQLLIFYID